LTGSGKADNTVHDNARAIKTLLRFWHAENYIPSPVTFTVPKVAKKRLPVLSAEELTKVVSACQNHRDKAAILVIADAGLRRAKTIALNWGDVDMSTRLLRVVRGKGGKARSSVVGSATRRALLQYRRTLKDTSDTAPLFQTRDGVRFTSDGFIQTFNRISKHCGIHITPHALRCTSVILSLRAGMDVLHLQAMLGHASLDMVRHYAQMVDDDILQAHEAYSPVDTIKRPK
jgi:integrase/recombinase XerD